MEGFLSPGQLLGIDARPTDIIPPVRLDTPVPAASTNYLLYGVLAIAAIVAYRKCFL
jgi:hypothetical protein